MLSIIEEIKFWTSIMRDHGEFQFSSLSCVEVDSIRTARYFMDLFDELNKEAEGFENQTKEKRYEFITKNKSALSQFIQFKKTMMGKLLNCRICISMTPTFLNHMINEALEFYRILTMNEQDMPVNTSLEILRLHKIWLPDASGHAKHIASSLDNVEGAYTLLANDYINRFDMLFKKSFELYMIYDRTKSENDGIIRLNVEVEKVMAEFIEFLNTVLELKKECLLLTTGIFSALIPDHMIREEKYYLGKVMSLLDVK